MTAAKRISLMPSVAGKHRTRVALVPSCKEELAMFQRLHHIAYRCRDAQRTVDFYTEVVGLKYVAGLMPPENNKPSWPLNEPGQPARKVVGEEADSLHIFFEL